MIGNLINALWITLIGMGLVFIAILALWGMMALIVRLTTEREGSEEGAEAAEDSSLPAEENSLPAEENSLPAEDSSLPAEETPVPAGPFDDGRKRRAVAAAVAVAMALRRPAESMRAMEPGGALSAWQAVHRASQISQRVQSSRKKVMQ